jgi:hypothetical protein
MDFLDGLLFFLETLVDGIIGARGIVDKFIAEDFCGG